MIKFLHFADVHLGVENYGHYQAQTGLHTRFVDFIRCLEASIDIALEEKVDFALFCGDAYKNNNPSPTYQREFAHQIYRLSDARIPTVLVNGNHDHSISFGRASALDIFRTLNIPYTYVFSDPGLLTLETNQGPIQVLAIPWPTRNQYLDKKEYRDNDNDSINKMIQKRLKKYILKESNKINSQLPAILAGHFTVAEALFSGSENYALIGHDPVIPKHFFFHLPYDYIALGHIHRHQDLNAKNSPPIVYSGSIERINFGEEKEDKGICLGSIDTKKHVDYEFISLPARKMITIEVKISQAENPTTQFIKIIEKYDLEGAIVRVVYEISEKIEHQLDFQKINHSLENAFLVTGITRNLNKKAHVKRSVLSEKMNLISALETYIRINQLTPWADDLKKNAIHLQQAQMKKDSTGEGGKI